MSSGRSDCANLPPKRNCMKLPIYCLLLLGILACGNDTPPAVSTSSPSPAAPPQPTVSGDIDYALMELGDMSVEGCTYLLHPEGEDGYFIGIDYAEEIAELRLDGTTVRLPQVGRIEDASRNYTSMTFANDAYSVRVSVTDENQLGAEVWEVSGRVKVTRQNGAGELTVNVVGERGC